MRSPTQKVFFHIRKKNHGGAMVEFAIVLPLLLLIIGGIIEFGLLVYNKQVITNASREGARAGIVCELDSDGDKISVLRSAVIDIVKNYCNNRLFDFSDDPENSLVVTPNPDKYEYDDTDRYDEDFSVTVDYEHTFMFGSFLNTFGVNLGPTINISATTVMKFE